MKTRLNTKAIALLMAAAGIDTQTALSEKTGISRQSICTIMARKSCTTANALKIARALGVDVTEIMEVE